MSELLPSSGERAVQLVHVVIAAVEEGVDRGRADAALADAIGLDPDIAHVILEKTPIVLFRGLMPADLDVLQPHLIDLSRAGIVFKLTRKPVGDLPKVNWPEPPDIQELFGPPVEDESEASSHVARSDAAAIAPTLPRQGLDSSTVDAVPPPPPTSTSAAALGSPTGSRSSSSEGLLPGLAGQSDVYAPDMPSPSSAEARTPAGMSELTDSEPAVPDAAPALVPSAPEQILGATPPAELEESSFDEAARTDDSGPLPAADWASTSAADNLAPAGIDAGVLPISVERPCPYTGRPLRITVSALGEVSVDAVESRSGSRVDSPTPAVGPRDEESADVAVMPPAEADEPPFVPEPPDDEDAPPAVPTEPSPAIMTSPAEIYASAVEPTFTSAGGDPVPGGDSDVAEATIPPPPPPPAPASAATNEVPAESPTELPAEDPPAELTFQESSPELPAEDPPPADPPVDETPSADESPAGETPSTTGSEQAEVDELMKSIGVSGGSDRHTVTNVELDSPDSLPTDLPALDAPPKMPKGGMFNSVAGLTVVSDALEPWTGKASSYVDPKLAYLRGASKDEVENLNAPAEEPPAEVSDDEAENPAIQQAAAALQSEYEDDLGDLDAELHALDSGLDDAPDELNLADDSEASGGLSDVMELGGGDMSESVEALVGDLPDLPNEYPDVPPTSTPARESGAPAAEGAFRVTLQQVPSKRRAEAMELLQSLAGVSADEAEQRITRFVVPVARGVARDEAESLRQAFEDAGFPARIADDPGGQ